MYQIPSLFLLYAHSLSNSMQLRGIRVAILLRGSHFKMQLGLGFVLNHLFVLIIHSSAVFSLPISSNAKIGVILTKSDFLSSSVTFVIKEINSTLFPIFINESNITVSHDTNVGIAVRLGTWNLVIAQFVKSEIYCIMFTEAS